MPPDFFARFPLREMSWRKVLGASALQSSRDTICAHVDIEELVPPADQVFAALEATPLSAVRVLLMGQDPYPTRGDAHGLSFSVAHGRPPRSLQNIFGKFNGTVAVHCVKMQTFLTGPLRVFCC